MRWCTCKQNSHGGAYLCALMNALFTCFVPCGEHVPTCHVLLVCIFGETCFFFPPLLPLLFVFCQRLQEAATFSLMFLLLYFRLKKHRQRLFAYNTAFSWFAEHKLPGNWFAVLLENAITPVGGDRRLPRNGRHGCYLPSGWFARLGGVSTSYYG